MLCLVSKSSLLALGTTNAVDKGGRESWHYANGKGTNKASR